MQFIVFHGSYGSPEGNWFPQLKQSLELLGQEVLVPEFPVDDYDQITQIGSVEKVKQTKQNLNAWTQTFKREILPQVKKSDELCFVGHSMGPLFILHLVDKFNLQLDSAIFVSPFMEDIGQELWQFYVVARSFYDADFDFEKLKKLIPISYVLYSDNDPYVPKQLQLDFADKLNSSPILVKRGGHLNAEVNLNEFPLVLELCKSRLDLNLYQKYLAHRRELYAVDYIEGKKGEEVIYLEPEEVFDEGVFKFRNLKKEGFCTFYVPYSQFWDSQSTYFQEARRAAQRIKELKRVFIVETKADLNKKSLQEQMKLDLEARIKVFLAQADKLRHKIGLLDFGIWDGAYLCSVTPDQVKLSSRKKDLDQAYQWRDIVLKEAVQITDLKTDIEKFKQENF